LIQRIKARMYERVSRSGFQVAILRMNFAGIEKTDITYEIRYISADPNADGPAIGLQFGVGGGVNDTLRIRSQRVSDLYSILQGRIA